MESDALTLNPHVTELLETRSAPGKSGRIFKDLHGLSTLNNLKTLDALLAARRPARTLEVGLYFGASALVFTEHHRRNNSAPGAHMAIDPSQLNPDYIDGGGVLSVERAGLAKWFEHRNEPSQLTLPALVAEGRTFDMIYIDGSHVFEDVFIDAYYCARLLSQGGLMLFDDSPRPSVAKVIKFIRTTLCDSLKEFDLFPFNDRPWWKYEAAHALGKVQLVGFWRDGEVARPQSADHRDF